MRKQSISSGKKIIHFKRWTRRRYAIFSSLGKNIKICRLRTDMCAGEEMKQGHKSCLGICVCMQAIPGKKEDDTGIPDMYRNTLDPALQETLRVQGKVAPIPQEGRCSKYRYINKNSEIPLSRHIVSGVRVFPYVNMTHDLYE